MKNARKKYAGKNYVPFQSNLYEDVQVNDSHQLPTKEENTIKGFIPLGNFITTFLQFSNVSL